MNWQLFPFLLLLGVSFQQLKTSISSKTDHPPGCVPINDTLFVDRNEMTNIDYREYQYWLIRVFGKNSDRYRATVLDTSVWQKVNGLAALSQTYHLDPIFNNYPTVGMTLQQAQLYTDWRTDRVAEMLLIENQLIRPDPLQNASNYFTLTTYLSGEYQSIPGQKSKRKRIKTLDFPIYRIPTSTEWDLFAGLDPDDLLAIFPANSHNRAVLKKYGAYAMTLDLYESKTNRDQQSIFPNGKKLVTAPYRLLGENQHGLFGIVGNVSELVDEAGQSKGGNWLQSTRRQSSDLSNPTEGPNCWTGFRNVCTLQRHNLPR